MIDEIADLIDLIDGFVSIVDGISDFLNLADFIQSITSDKKKKSVYRISESSVNENGEHFVCILICTNMKTCKIRVLKSKNNTLIYNKVIKFERTIVEEKYNRLISNITRKYNVNFTTNDLSKYKYLGVKKYFKSNVRNSFIAKTKY